MFQLQAPYPTLQTGTVLPSPQFSDAMNLTVAVSVQRAMDGTRYTYVKTKGGRRKFKWTFILSRNKALELRAFIWSYFASKVLVTDHRGRQWMGNFTSNPFEFDTSDKADPPIAPMPRGALVNIDLEFEGVRYA
jgi:hypothetical protein